MPAPTGPAPAMPKAGTLGSLLSWTLLPVITVQDVAGVEGQAPFWGEGASSLLRELGTMPVRLPSHSEFWILRCPPALVPEKPRALCWACTWSRTALQSGQAPT